MKQMKLPDDCRVMVGPHEVTLLVAFANVDAADVPALEEALGGPLQDADALYVVNLQAD